MHYRDGTPVELGDKVTVADADSVPADIHGGATGSFAKMPDYYKTEQGKQEYTGVVVGRDTGGGCGVAILQPKSDVPFVLQPALCSQYQAGSLIVEQGKLATVAPAFLKKLA